MNELTGLARQILERIWRRRYLALITAWVVCLAGWAAVYSIPNSYEANARLYVDSDAVLTPLLRGLALDDSPTNQLDILQRTLLSRPNLEKLISKTDLELTIRSPTDLERLSASLAETIRITPQTHNLFTISYRNTSPKLAYDVVQTILSIFVESKTGTSRSDMENARQFLEQQLSSYEQQLRKAEARRADFMSKYMDLLPAAGGGATHLDGARQMVTDLQGQLKDLQLREDILKGQLKETPEFLRLTQQEAAVMDTNRMSQNNMRLSQAEADLAKLRLKYTDNHPDVIAAKQLVESLRSQSAMQPDLAPIAAANTAANKAAAASTGAIKGENTRTTLPNPIYGQLKSQLFEANAQEMIIKRRLDDAVRARDHLEEVARGVPGLQAEFVDVNRDYDVLRRNYDELLHRRESMRIAAAADTEADKMKLEVVDPPQIPRIPVAPKRQLLLSVVLVLGLGMGIGVPVLLMQFDSSFHSIEDLRKLELPVIGGVSLIANAVSWRVRATQIAIITVGLIVLGGVYGGLMLRLASSAVA